MIYQQRKLKASLIFDQPYCSLWLEKVTSREMIEDKKERLTRIMRMQAFTSNGVLETKYASPVYLSEKQCPMWHGSLQLAQMEEQTDTQSNYSTPAGHTGIG